MTASPSSQTDVVVFAVASCVLQARSCHYGTSSWRSVNPSAVVLERGMALRRLAMIETPSRAVRAYLRAASVCAVVILPGQTVTCVRDVGKLQQAATDAWWTTAAGALAIVRQLS
jgi:hypothetical protein